jgi:hypothetical protein
MVVRGKGVDWISTIWDMLSLRHMINNAGIGEKNSS